MWGRFLVLASLLCLALPGVSCLRNIPQDDNTGKDGRRKGAKRIRLEDGEGRAKKDVVTYPGGDRVDWKYFEIPPEAGFVDLRVKLKSKPPRPGHDVTFTLYDQYYHRVARVKRAPEERTKKVRIRPAEPGKYWVQVYAPKRMDAGEYRLSVRYKPWTDPGECKADKDCDSEYECRGGACVLNVQLPDPPALYAIPEAECAADTDCQDGFKCAEGKCVKAAAEPECTADTDCEDDQVCSGGSCVAKPSECIKGRVVRFSRTSSGELIVTVDRGSKKGVASGWQGEILTRGSSEALEGGTFKVIKVTDGESIGKVKLSIDQVKANRSVRICGQ